jgi:hypothetical protein
VGTVPESWIGFFSANRAGGIARPGSPTIEGMEVLRHGWSLGLFFVACGGSAPEAQAPSSTTEAAPAAAPAMAPEGGGDKPGADGWEGEGDAKGTAAGAGETKPAAPPGKSDVEEKRTIEVIQKLVKERRPEVRECYEKARKDLPSLQGDMIIHFVLDPEGKVKTIELNQERSTLKTAAVADCAIKTIKSISFPPSTRGMETNVNYPYNFMPGGPPQR